MKNLLKILFLLFLLTPLFVAAQTKGTNEILVCEPQIYTLTGDTAYCAGTGGVSITLDTSQTGISYQLYKDGTVEGLVVAGTGNSLIWNNLLAGTYTVIAANDTNQSCTSLMNGSVPVVENPLPTVYAGQDQIISTGGTANLNATVSGGSGSYYFQWTPSILVANANAQNTITISLNNSIQFLLYVTDSVTMCSNSDTVCILSSCSPPPINATALQDTICMGDTVILSVFCACGNNYTYIWSSIPSGFYSTLNNPVATPSITTTYTVTASYGGPQIITSSVVVTVTSMLNTDTLSTHNHCIEGNTGSVSLNSSDSGVSYLLFNNDSAIGLSLNGTGNILQWDSLSAGSYYVMAYDSTLLECNTYISNTIIITESPIVDLGNDTTLCMNQYIMLEGPTDTGYNYTWIKLPDDTLSNNQSLYLDTLVSGMGTTTYILNVSNSYNCFNADTINIEFDDCVSVPENEETNIDIYPNPATDKIFIKTKNQNVTKIEIYSIYGALLLSTDITNAVNISHLTGGIYLIKIYFNDTYIMHKFVKK